MYLVLVPYVVLVVVYIIIFRVHQPLPSPGTITSAIFKCLPVIYLIILMLIAPKIEPDRSYRYAIALGYTFSLGGDWFLNWPKSYFIQGLVCFALAQMCYVYGFGFTPFGGVSFIVFVIAAGCILKILIPSIRQTPLKIAVVLYMALLGVAAWRATVRYKERPQWDTWMAMSGALVFTLSDFSIAFNRWKMKFSRSILFIMITYYIAQLMFAISVLMPVLETAKKMRFMGV